MQDYAILGNDVTLEVYNGTDYVELLCAKSCSINVSTEQILKTTVGNGYGIKRAVRRIEWGVSYSGVNAITSYGFGIFSFDLLDIDTIISGYLIKLTFTDPQRNDKIFTGRVFLNSAILTGNVREFSDSDFDMIGDGLYNLIDTSDSPDTGESPESPETPDMIIPEIDSVTANAATTSDVVFSEPMNVTAAGWNFTKYDGVTSTNRVITGLTGSGTNWQFTFSDSALSTDNLGVFYDTVVGGTLDYGGNEPNPTTFSGYTNLI